MTALATSFAAPAATLPRPKASDFTLSPMLQAVIGVVGIGFTAASVLALGRYGAGLVPSTQAIKSVAVMLHVATVVPAVPLGAYLLLARKGTPRHKSLGKVWVVLMVLTALSALFICHSATVHFSPIHIFVPLTLHGAWKTIATARRRDIAGHKKALVTMYLAALVIPGLFAFAPDRVMGIGLFG